MPDSEVTAYESPADWLAVRSAYLTRVVSRLQRWGDQAPNDRRFRYTTLAARIAEKRDQVDDLQRSYRELFQ